MQKVYFPVQLDKMGAHFGFQNYDEENKRLRNGNTADIIAKAVPHNHYKAFSDHPCSHTRKEVVVAWERLPAAIMVNRIAAESRSHEKMTFGRCHFLRSPRSRLASPEERRRIRNTPQ